MRKNAVLIVIVGEGGVGWGLVCVDTCNLMFEV